MGEALPCSPGLRNLLIFLCWVGNGLCLLINQFLLMFSLGFLPNSDDNFSFCSNPLIPRQRIFKVQTAAIRRNCNSKKRLGKIGFKPFAKEKTFSPLTATISGSNKGKRNGVQRGSRSRKRQRSRDSRVRLRETDTRGVSKLLPGTVFQMSLNKEIKKTSLFGW